MIELKHRDKIQYHSIQIHNRKRDRHKERLKMCFVYYDNVKTNFRIENFQWQED